MVYQTTQQSLRFYGPSNVASRQEISFSRISIQIKSSTSPLIHGFGNKNLEIYKAEFAGSGRISRVSLAGTIWYPILRYFRYDYDLIRLDYECYECHWLHHGILWYFMAAWFGQWRILFSWRNPMYFPPCEEGLGGLRFDSLFWYLLQKLGRCLDPCESDKFYLCMIPPAGRWQFHWASRGKDKDPEVLVSWLHVEFLKHEPLQDCQAKSMLFNTQFMFPCISNIEILVVLIYTYIYIHIIYIYYIYICIIYICIIYIYIIYIYTHYIYIYIHIIYIHYIYIYIIYTHYIYIYIIYIYICVIQFQKLGAWGTDFLLAKVVQMSMIGRNNGGIQWCRDSWACSSALV